MDSMEMGYTFEELIRKFAEQSNETAGEHFTPREVIRLMVNVLFIEDKDILTQDGIVKTLYDPACGTGGMLSVGEQYVKELNPKAELKVFGQEINPESYAICKSDMLIKGQNPSNIKFGNTFTVDGLEEVKFDYMLSNPPFGVDWKKDEKIINHRYYHTIKEVKNGEGPHPIKTEKGWLHLAHGVRNCAAGLRYVLYLYLTDLQDPSKLIAEPAGHFMAPQDEERVGDVSNVLFSNGWIADDDGKVFIYYASSDTRMHVATSTIDKLLDYVLHTPADGYRSATSVESIKALIARNKEIGY